MYWVTLQLFTFFLLCVVLQVESCDRLVLKPNQTTYLVTAGDSLEVRCLCNEGSDERAAWYYANGTRVPVARQIKSRDQPHHKKHKSGSGEILVLPQISGRNGVGVYRCEGGSLVKNITVELSNGSAPALPIILESPANQHILVKTGDESLMLLCRVDGDGVIVYWQKNKRNISSSEVVDIQGKSEFTINNVTKRDEGIYQCVATNSAGLVTSTEATVIITGYINASIIPIEQSVEVTKRTKFTCEGMGYQSEYFKYQWRLNGTEIFGANNKTLDISSANETHAGVYDCIVTNQWNDTSVSAPAQLTITRHLPVITSHPMDVTALLHYGNESVVFSCEANGSDIQYTWFTESNNGSMMMIGGLSNKLVLSPVTIEMNNTQYHCVASNNSGNTTSNSAHLIINVLLQAIIVPSNKSIEVRTRFHFTCEADGYRAELFKYQWKLNGTDIVNATSRTLTIRSADESDRGTYQCIVTSDWNEVSTLLAQLTITRNPPRILKNPDNVTVLINNKDFSEVSFDCKTTISNHTWLVIPPNKDPIYYEKSGVTTTSSQTINLTLTMNGTSVLCVASNASGSVMSTVAILTILVPPPMIITQPQQLVNISIGEAVILHCMATSYGDTVNLKYHWFKVFDDDKKFAIDGANSSNFVINHITSEHDNTSYQCAATNENGTTYSKVARINVLPLIIRHPESMSVLVNTSLVLYCEATGVGNLTYQWRKDDELLPSQNNDNNLIIDTVDFKDAGSYLCEVTNHRGEITVSLPAIIIVHESLAIRNLTVESTDNASVTVRWRIPQALAPILNKILVIITSKEHNITNSYPANTEAVTINSLVPSLSYNISVVAVYNSSKITSVPTSIKVMIPDCQVCSEPKLIDTLQKELSDLSFTLQWHPLPNKTFLDSFILFYSNSSLVYERTQVKRQQPRPTSVGPIPSDVLEYAVDNLTPYSTYCFWLQAVYSKENVTFDHKESKVLCDIKTPSTEPSAPLHLRVEEINSTWVSISWTPPLFKNGIIQYFTVYYGVSDELVWHQERVSVREITNRLPLWYQILNLTPNTSYVITTSATTSDGGEHYLEGPRSNDITVKTLPVNISSSEKTTVQSKSQTKALVIGIAAGLSIAVLFVLIVGIIWYCGHRRKQLHKISASGKSRPKASGVPVLQLNPPTEGIPDKSSAPYINVADDNFITSANQPTTLCISTGGFPPPEIEWFKDNNIDPVNHPVLSDGSLYIIYTTPNDAGCYTVKATNSVDSVVRKITVSVLKPSPPTDHESYKPIKVEDFAAHVSLLQENKEHCFDKECSEATAVNQTFSHHNAKLAVNQNKNRYTNIVPYDHSRVVIGINHKHTGSDYINASLINGYSKAGEYIATQAPIPSTYGDFWKMIWEKKSTTIVMLANLQEDGKVKCHQYWPSHGHAVYGSHRVTLQAVDCSSDCTIRVFTLEMINERSRTTSDTLEIHQFQFTTWPLHGELPQDTSSLLSFHKRVDEYHQHGDAPMIVHCSAGLERTGIFIVIDAQIQRIKNESTVDIFNNVRQLCYSRNHIIQTQEQYEFIYKVLLEYVSQYEK